MLNDKEMKEWEDTYVTKTEHCVEVKSNRWIPLTLVGWLLLSIFSDVNLVNMAIIAFAAALWEATK